MSLCNLDVRKALRINNITFEEVAHYFGCSKKKLRRVFADEMTDDMKAKMLFMIVKMIAER